MAELEECEFFRKISTDKRLMMKKNYLLLFLTFVLVGCQNEMDVSKQNKDQTQSDIQEEVEIAENTNIPASLLNEISQQISVPIEDITEGDLLKVKSINITSQNNDDVSALSEMKNLESLYVSAPIDISSISELNNLKYLYLMNMNYPITKFDFLTSHEQLNTLDIQNSGIEDLKEFPTLKKLESLSLVNNQVQDLAPIENLTSLEVLDITNNQITSLSPLENLMNLHSLSLDNNPIKDATPIGKLSSLLFLSINGIPIDSIEFVQELNKLERLQISDTEVSDLSSLVNLKSLSYLDIRNTNVTSIKALRELESLHILLLNKDKVKDWKSLENKAGLRISETVILAE
ncbi:leucine-rich repeat domain-containing protein [Psychrobacillus sp. FJAT-51614]